MAALFTSARLGKLQLANRILVAPMCQYSAIAGVAQPWHEQHWGHLAVSGAAALTIEATAVEPCGMITHGCLGLWNDLQAEALRSTLTRIRGYANLPIGIQLAHAGRKGSVARPWDGGQPLREAENAWRTVAPSALPWSVNWPEPLGLDEAGMDRIVQAFAHAANLANASGMDFIELHAAHGYLMHSFLSSVSNQRSDSYGGSIENRMRFPLSIVRAVRQCWPQTRTMGMRINGTDWVEGGWTVADAVHFATSLVKEGVDYLSVSSGGVRGGVAIKLEPGYQVPLATAVRRAIACPVICAGLIAEPQHAESIIATQKADFVALARAMLDDPRWPIHAARTLNGNASFPPPYQLAAVGKWPLASTNR